MQPLIQTDPREKDHLAIVLLMVLATLAFADILFFGQQLYLRDLTRYYYPTKRILREIVFSGSFPFWNPYYGAGQPMAANPEYEVFYPPQWLVFLPDFNFGFRLHIVVHVHATLAGMYLLLRSMKRSVIASILAAISWGLGGVFLSFVNLLPILFCAAWIPWLLMYGRRCLLEFSWRDVALTGLFGGLQLFAAEPTTLLQTWFLLGCYGLYRIASAQRPWWRAWLTTTLSLGAMLAATLAVGAAQLFPALGHVGDSARSLPFELGLVTTWSMPAARVIELLFPNVFGHISDNRVMWYWAGGLYGGVGSPFVFSIYLGQFTLACVAAGLRTGGRERWLLAAILAPSFLLALGGNTPLFRILHEAGIARSLRYPEKFILMGLFALILFAARSADRIFEGDRKAWQTAWAFAIASLGVASILAILSLTPWYPDWFTTLWGPRGANTKFLVNLTRIDWMIAVGRACLLMLLVYFVRAGRPGRGWSAAAVLLVSADLAPLGYQVNPRMPQRFFDRPEIASKLDADRHNYRVFHEADWYGTSAVARRYFSAGSAVYWMVRNGLHPMTTATWGYATVLDRDYDKTALLPTLDLLRAMWKVRDERPDDWREILMPMSNARYHVEYVPFDEAKKVGNLERAQPVKFIKAADELPRFYLARRLVHATSVEGFVNRVRSKDWTRGTAVVGFAPFATSEGVVSDVKEEPNTIRLNARCEGPCYLVLSVTPHRYWRAVVDGRPARLHVTNLAFQGLVLPEGTHRVELTYRNDVVIRSAVLSILATLACLIVVIVTRGRTAANAPVTGSDPSTTWDSDRSEPPGPDLEDATQPGAVRGAEGSGHIGMPVEQQPSSPEQRPAAGNDETGP